MFTSLICSGSCLSEHIYQKSIFIPYMESHYWENTKYLASFAFPNEDHEKFYASLYKMLWQLGYNFSRDIWHNLENK